ncbi:hypothetical protein Btru_068725 [Bulinus truncatus]|nr:hypothetical protein Btru_068725 [Bulinus truncatus]
MIYGAVESKYRHYANITERLKTFQKWLNDYTKTPEELADAGFFYEGYADCVRCFHCAGKTRGWEADDDPWIEHARWFPKCEYVSERKGKNFVAAVQDLSRTHPKISAQMVVERMREINQ